MSKVFSAMVAGLFFVSSFGAAGCAAEAEDGDEFGEEIAGSSEADLTITPTRQAQLDALRARVTQDFSKVASLKNKKLVFVVRRYKSDASKAVLFGHIMKRDAAGHDSELTDADFKGSVFEPAIEAGVFDGPEVFSVLKNTNGKWGVAKKGNREAYVVGPTDVAFYDWDTQYGVPRGWLGL